MLRLGELSRAGGHSAGVCSALGSGHSLIVLARPYCLECEVSNMAREWVDGIEYDGNCAIKAKPDIVNAVLREGTVTIGEAAFVGCARLEEIDLPNSVQEIGCNAFAGCTSLKVIELPDSVKEIGCGAFAVCSFLV